ncbi:MAG TPA: hypothetical protein VLG50_03155 [Candidatus Saccharimonadales bacterium]|nr:hypothetical protein [Candidatus Saccharimonadales bacterium]
MKTKTSYIFISLLSAQIEMQAPPKKTFKGTPAKISQASTLYIQDDQCESVTPVESLEIPQDTAPQKNTSDESFVQSLEQQFDITDITQAAAAVACGDLETEKLPEDAHQSSARFASLEEVAGKAPLTVKEIQELGALKQLQEQGWDTTTNDEPASKQKKPEQLLNIDQSWMQALAKIPQRFWQEHVSDKNRVERIARQVGIRTYRILHQKQQAGTLVEFIHSLNGSKSTEGYQWLEEGVRQAIDDEKEEMLRAILHPNLSPHLVLRKITCELATTYLQHCGIQRRTAFEKDAAELTQTISLLSPPPPEVTQHDPNDGDDD